MRLASFTPLLAAAALAASGIGVARADVYALSFLESENRLVVRELASTASAAGAFDACCAVISGTATPDPAGNTVWFVRASPTGDELRGLRYGGGTSLSVPLTAGYRVTHLEWDAPANRLLGFAVDAVTDRAVPIRIDIATGTITPLGALSADCCTLNLGVSALTRNGDPRLLVTGRRTTDTSDQLLEFNMTTGALERAVALADLRIDELVRHPVTNVVYGLGHGLSTNAAQPFALNASLVPGAIGAGLPGCCFALAGGAAIDRATNKLVVLSAAFGGAQFNARAFDLATGVATDGPVLTANLLFEDSGVVFGVLFANGFE